MQCSRPNKVQSFVTDPKEIVLSVEKGNKHIVLENSKYITEKSDLEHGWSFGGFHLYTKNSCSY